MKRAAEANNNISANTNVFNAQQAKDYLRKSRLAPALHYKRRRAVPRGTPWGDAVALLACSVSAVSSSHLRRLLPGPC